MYLGITCSLRLPFQVINEMCHSFLSVMKERQLEELRQKDRSYQREVSKLEKRVVEAEAQAVALESYAPPPEVDPIALLQEIRRKAELLLGERNAVLGLPEEGGGYHGPLSEEVEEEASRWVSRKLLGQL